MLNKRTIALVVPCYNEASRGNDKDDLKNRLQRLNNEIDKNVVTNVIFVDDGSLDNTSNVIEYFINENYLFDSWNLIKIYKNEGKGRALMTGLEFASNLAPYIAYIDADLSVSANYLNNAIDCCSKSMIVCGYRKYQNQNFARRFANKLAKICNKYMIGIKSRDTQCPLKVFSSESFLKVKDNLKGYRWIFDIELLWELEKRGYFIHEKYVIFNNLESGSLSTSKAILRCAKDVVDFKIVRIKRRIDYLKNKNKENNLKQKEKVG